MEPWQRGCGTTATLAYRVNVADEAGQRVVVTGTLTSAAGPAQYVDETANASRGQCLLPLRPALRAGHHAGAPTVALVSVRVRSWVPTVVEWTTRSEVDTLVRRVVQVPGSRAKEKVNDEPLL
ncbi:MAG: hypothetical protein R2991_05130 [Thermoanaerobaculia bacterium]